MASKLLTVGLTMGTFDGRSAKCAPKTARPFYQTPEFRVWRDQVVTRAGGRCEAVDNGRRCWKAAPNRMFADHKVEVSDGGALLDPDNGQCLCGAHHSSKTAQARAARRTS